MCGGVRGCIRMRECVCVCAVCVCVLSHAYVCVCVSYHMCTFVCPYVSMSLQINKYTPCITLTCTASIISSVSRFSLTCVLFVCVCVYSGG